MDKKYWWCRKLLDDGTYYYMKAEAIGLGGLFGPVWSGSST